MKTELPVVRKTAWGYVFAQLILLLLLALFLWKAFFPTDMSMAATWAAVVYLVYSFGSKSVLLKNHREGMLLARKQAFREAIDKFQRSYEFLEKYPWLDKYRFITMLDSSARSYREMALCNIAYSHVQLDDAASALKYYQRALEEYPQSELAQSGLEYVAGTEN
jgi:tetratricopeptide (TPR) repeat protein